MNYQSALNITVESRMNAQVACAHLQQWWWRVSLHVHKRAERERLL
ncbi:MAG: hypothetical protein H0V88_02955 [Pyrinomonadaceae bacterium]|nr:hypothetical protein [Pyrinomonadaceae bacterium]